MTHALLRRSFGPFFARFGRLNDVQVAAVPIVLAGRSLLLTSPTASGKTEAAVAPLVERHLPGGTSELRILYVVPTRALVNDLGRRLEGPLAAMSLPLALKTGDIPTLRPTEPAAVLVTTPESLDSLLCRQPRRFSTLQALVLDELHLVDGTYRGDQLRVLLERLPAGLQRLALSATVHAPELMARRYLGPEAEVLAIGEPRGLDFHLAPDLADAVAMLKREKRHKAIVFCNRRKDVEEVVQKLGELWPKNRIVAHHGSLSTKERTSAEQAMRDWPWGLCVATMTLEVGIDVGDVDAVVLYGPPHTPSAFQQRVGRGCRREARGVAIGVCLAPEDEAEFGVLAELAVQGVVEAHDVLPDPSVVVQQLFSLLFGHPTGLDRAHVEALVRPLVEPHTLSAILDHLTREGYVERAGLGRLRASTKLMDLGEKGRIHSNVPNVREQVFVDGSGRQIGKLELGVAPGDVLMLGGRAWKVRAIRGSTVQVEASSLSVAVREFKKRRDGGAFRWLLPEAMRAG